MATKRIGYFDIAKGIGILLVVWAHAYCPAGSYMYQFHMPLFFIISGLLYNDKTPILPYIKKKFTVLYIPFVFWNLLFYIGKSLQRGIKVGKIFEQTWLILLTVGKDGQYFGATWFLGALLCVSIVYKLLDFILRKVKYREYILFVISCGLAVWGFEVTLDYMISRTLILGMFFSAGAMLRKYSGIIFSKKGWHIAAAGLIGFVLIRKYNAVNMGANTYTYKSLFIATSFVMTYVIILFCHCLDDISFKPVKYLVDIIKFTGRNSMDILIWQFVCFRAVIIIQMLLNHEALTVKSLLSYYPVYSTANGWWAAYFFAGVVLPLLWCAFLRSGKWGKLFKAMHIV